MQLVLDELTQAETLALGVPMPRDKRLRSLCESVLRAPGERNTLAQWAGQIGASERTVARLFRTELGTRYQQWRQQAMLAHALSLLARGTPDQRGRGQRAATPATARSRPCSRPRWGSRRASSRVASTPAAADPRADMPAKRSRTKTRRTAGNIKP
jgi:AraC-like DNA-binding protein